ncbi:hypothetical protein M409DRAFT_61744 [Zasmidium cellare ATCC 36951]|uniref:Uncharacterized protein n=1 Tax=Zasmidium cellare ATCC 36951 TaxID=1080233 RepID=A0A6A6BV12_ZASCE|nr:uncharacterized protein M409DRAFT_61744 [Zasmidium cellare ATCC 36951]KAF2158343.1 hypothetical protein M409DRAFT_61744 [Zasmidium cellare ATCC 36951]
MSASVDSSLNATSPEPHLPSSDLLTDLSTMPSRLTIFAIVAAVLAILFSPQIASFETSDSCIVAAPPQFVKQKAIDFDFIRSVQATGGSAFLDALRLSRNGHYFSASLSERDEYLELTPPRRKDGVRKAKVVHNDHWKFVYREDFKYGQRVMHWISVRPSGKHTVLEYDRRWKGSLGVACFEVDGI